MVGVEWVIGVGITVVIAVVSVTWRLSNTINKLNTTVSELRGDIRANMRLTEAELQSLRTELKRSSDARHKLANELQSLQTRVNLHHVFLARKYPNDTVPGE